MTKKRKIIGWTVLAAALLCAPAALALQQYAFSHPNWVESRWIPLFYAPASQTVSMIFGLLPFSFAELMVVTAIIWIPLLIIFLYRRARKNNCGKMLSAASAALHVLAIASVFYFCYMAFCGVQYARPSLYEALELENSGMTVSELTALCDELTAQANTLRAQLPEDENGVFRCDDLSDILARTRHNYEIAAQNSPILTGRYSQPKKVLLSPLWAYTETTGMFFPYTIEANINAVNSPAMFASTAAHEAAHQRGFMREDESNFLAWYVCMQSDCPQDRYSGYFLALIHAGNALYRASPQAYAEIREKYSDALARDLIAHNELWDRYEGKTAEISEQVNNTYLKSNNQTDGTRSYGRMVDLLGAWYRKNGLFD